MFHDKRGLEMTATSQATVDAFDDVVEELLCSGRDTVRLLDNLGKLDPEMVMGQVLRGYFMHLPSRMYLVPDALDGLEKARALAVDVTDRERRHVEALATWCAGDLGRCAAIFESILLDHPHDILALRLAHHLHFFTGDLSTMLSSTARAMPHWSGAVPGYGYVLGFRAFSLEENGDPIAGEPFGRRAVEMNEADIWSGHAVAHCLETTGRRLDGISWITAHGEAWRHRGTFANHLWWHRSLHYLELERFDDVLDAFDNEFWPKPSEDNIDISNAASILMRLVMLDLDVGDRWESVADVSVGRIGDCLRPFNDLHFVMALAMSGRLEQAEAMVAAMRAYAEENADEGITTAIVGRDAGLPVADAIIAYARDDHAAVVETMMDARYRMVPLGGSWAQRDCWVRMLIDSARKDGRNSLARALLAERVAEYPKSAPSWRQYADALERNGAVAEASAARGRAAALLPA